MSETSKLNVTISPYRKGLHYGNIIWAERNEGSAYYRVSRFAARGGRFPPNHPVGGDTFGEGSQGGSGENIKAFRARGYWASCFPEGDGITYQPLKGQSDEQCLKDAQECFGWTFAWQRGYEPETSHHDN